MKFGLSGFSKCVLVTCLCLGGSLSWGWAAAPGGTAAPVTDLDQSAQELEKKKNRLREGAKVVDASGTFEWVGDRLSFRGDSEEISLKLLENRMMERVVQTQENSTGELVWIVTGTITEYRGSNFLLLSHVILKGKRHD